MPKTESSSLAVRQAVPEDVDWIMRELKDFSAFFGTKKPLLGDETYARNFIAAVIKDHVFLIAHRGAERVGFISGTLTPHSFNPDIKVLSEMFWWVPPRYRTSRAALMLLDAFVGFGKEHADWISFGLEAESPVRDQSLTRRGFRLKERAFLMEAH